MPQNFGNLFRCSNILISVAVIFVASISAKAEDSSNPLPIYDVDALCRQTYSKDDPSQYTAVINLCIHDEQESYNYLKSVWPQASGQLKLGCLNQIADNPVYTASPKYDLLAHCVGPRLEIERATKQQSFRP